MEQSAKSGTTLSKKVLTKRNAMIMGGGGRGWFGLDGLRDVFISYIVQKRGFE